MAEINQENLNWLTNCPPSDLNFKLNLLQANEETIAEAIRIKQADPHNKTAMKALQGRLAVVKLKNTMEVKNPPHPEVKPLSMASQLLACRLCHNAHPQCGRCCKSCSDTCNCKQKCYHDLPEKELVNRSHILIKEDDGMARKDVPVSAAEKRDPALHMEMETLRGEREERLNAVEVQVAREKQIADAYQIAGEVRALTFTEKVVTVARLMRLKVAKETKVYRDLPNIGTWDKYCEYVGLDRHTTDERLRQLDVFGAEFLETCNQFSVSHRDLRKLRQLTHDGTVIIDGDCLTIGSETIPINPDHADELQAAIEQIITAKAEIEKRVTKLEKDFNGAVKEEVKGYQSKEKALLKEVERLKAFDPEEKDREWSVEQMKQIEKAAGEFVVLVQKFIIDPRMNDDRHLQALVSGHLQGAEMALYDQRNRLNDVINMFND